MQNELTNVAQEKFIRNKHLACHLRTGLRQRMAGCDTALAILEDLTDEQLVVKYLAYNALKTIPFSEVSLWAANAY
jgi:hypothetical protein